MKQRPALTAGHVEYAAMANEVFDDIWTTNDYVVSLSLGEEYEIYRKSLNYARRVREGKLAAAQSS